MAMTVYKTTSSLMTSQTFIDSMLSRTTSVPGSPTATSASDKGRPESVTETGIVADGGEDSSLIN
jgi:hypothetical protein